MKIAIHATNKSFSDSWIGYCKQSNVPYKIVNCYSSDIIEQLYDCDALMWHHSQNNPSDLIVAKQILFALEQAGKVVFPDFKTNWHFDDKLGQKYLLEALGIPFVKSYVFFDKKNALNWVENSQYPVVFKLRGGAGSSNVKLIKSAAEARSIVKKAFGKGFANFNAWGNLKEVIRKKWLGKISWYHVIESVALLVYPPRFARVMGREYGYVYFQEFIPANDHDIRVIVIADKAFAIKRMVRTNDFRASGSGFIKYGKENFDDQTILIAFDIAKKLNTQVVAFDFIYKNGYPLIIEISYGFVKEGYDACQGYWDSNLNWHEGKFNPYGWMVEEVIKAVDFKK